MLYLYLPIAGKISRLKSKRCYYRDGERGQSWGQGHLTLLLTRLPPVLLILSLNLLVSIGIFFLGGHTIFLLSSDAPGVASLGSCKVLV